MTADEPTADPIDPKTAPEAGGSDAAAPADDLEPGNRHPLSADEGEPDVEPFAGDDDILSGHIGTDG